MKIIGGEPVFDCPYCSDTGVALVANIWLTIRGGRPLRSFWTGQTNHLPICGVSCVCNRANLKSRLPRLSVETMFLMNQPGTVDELAAKFRQWWGDGSRFHREKAFDDWNQGAFV